MAIHEDLDGHEIAALTSAGASFVGRRVREIGCGDGRLTRRYAHEAASIVAIDPDPDAIGSQRRSRPSTHGPSRSIGWNFQREASTPFSSAGRCDELRPEGTVDALRRRRSNCHTKLCHAQTRELWHQQLATDEASPGV